MKQKESQGKGKMNIPPKRSMESKISEGINKLKTSFSKNKHVDFLFHLPFFI